MRKRKPEGYWVELMNRTVRLFRESKHPISHEEAHRIAQNQMVEEGLQPFLPDIAPLEVANLKLTGG